MSSLYNHTTALTPSFNTMTQPSKTMRTNMGRYPGGVGYLTDKDIQDPSIEMTTGNNTNGRVQVSLQTRTLDQDYVNKYQFVWLDNKKFRNPKFLNLQSLNYELLKLQRPTEKHDIHALEKYKKTGKSMKEIILDRYPLFGVIANNDVDNDYDTYMVRNPRGLTFTIWGATHVLDYWSNREDGRVAPYSTCFFILKEVKVEPDTLFQRTLKSSTTDTGIYPTGVKWPLDDEGNQVGEYFWQVVPFHYHKFDIPTEELITNIYDEDGKTIKRKSLAHYWKVGHVHEYPDIADKHTLNVRDRYSVSRNMSYLHMTGAVRPFQFYMDISTENILF